MAAEPRVRVLGLCPRVPAVGQRWLPPRAGVITAEAATHAWAGLGTAALLNGKQIPILPPALLCSHRWAQTLLLSSLEVL